MVVLSLDASVRASPVCAQVPGNIRRAEHFCAFLKRFIEYLKQRMTVQAVVQESPTTFMTQLQERMDIDGAPVVLFSYRPLLACPQQEYVHHWLSPCTKWPLWGGLITPRLFPAMYVFLTGGTGCYLGICSHQAWMDRNSL